MAEIELAVLAGKCLDRRLADQATLEDARIELSTSIQQFKTTAS